MLLQRLAFAHSLFWVTDIFEATKIMLIGIRETATTSKLGCLPNVLNVQWEVGVAGAAKISEISLCVSRGCAQSLKVYFWPRFKAETFDQKLFCVFSCFVILWCETIFVVRLVLAEKNNVWRCSSISTLFLKKNLTFSFYNLPPTSDLVRMKPFYYWGKNYFFRTQQHRNKKWTFDATEENLEARFKCLKCDYSFKASVSF